MDLVSLCLGGHQKWTLSACASGNESHETKLRMDLCQTGQLRMDLAKLVKLGHWLQCLLWQSHKAAGLHHRRLSVCTVLSSGLHHRRLSVCTVLFLVLHHRLGLHRPLLGPAPSLRSAPSSTPTLIPPLAPPRLIFNESTSCAA
jgi:hypothetical protein